MKYLTLFFFLNRTSPWDVKENLPLDYARIFQFKSFDRVKRRIIKEAADVEGAEVCNNHFCP